MTLRNDNSSYDFESQLQLGELLLSLGRIEDAEAELRKAKELNDIGAYTTPDDDPKRQEDLQRLAIALDRVVELRSGANRRTRVLQVLGLLALLGLLAAVFTSWMFNRADLIVERESADGTAAAVSVLQTQQAAVVRDVLNEATRLVGEIEDGKRGIATANAAATTVLEVAGRNEMILATSIAQIQLGIPTSETDVASQQTAQADPAQPVEPTPTVSEDDEVVIEPEVTASAGDENNVRITAPAANLRRGPGFEYGVRSTLPNGTLLAVEAVSSDSYWYSVETDDGDIGWVHSSLAKPASLDWLPVAAPPPTNTPRPLPTNTPLPLPTNTAVPATSTPRPQPTNTPVQPTSTPLPRPTETSIPAPTNTITAVPSTNTAVPPTNTAVPAQPTNTAIPATNTPESGDAGGNENAGSDNGASSVADPTNPPADAEATAETTVVPAENLTPGPVDTAIVTATPDQ